MCNEQLLEASDTYPLSHAGRDGAKHAHIFDDKNCQRAIKFQPMFLKIRTFATA